MPRINEEDEEEKDESFDKTPRVKSQMGDQKVPIKVDSAQAGKCKGLASHQAGHASLRYSTLNTVAFWMRNHTRQVIRENGIPISERRIRVEVEQGQVKLSIDGINKI